MRKLILVAAACIVLASANRAAALGATEYTDQQSHPLRFAATILNPVGFTLEWLFFRPFHQLTSQPDLAPIFGQEEDPYRGTPFGSSLPRGADYNRD